jgi:RNA polymerase sigma-70 factor (ECF subfamily)
MRTAREFAENNQRDDRDRQLLTRLRNRDEGALDELINRFGTKVYQLALRQLHNKEDAEEVAQDVLFKVYRKIGAFRGDSALSSWIYRITFNASMSRLRTARRRRGQISETDAPDIVTADGERLTASVNETPDWSDLPDDQVLRAELRRRVFRAILALPVIYRAPVMLRDIQGMSTEEASAMLQVKDQTLKSRLHRGRLILRKQLADFAGGLTLHSAAA